MFDGFEEFDISTAGVSIHGRRGGSGPPLLLLHGIVRGEYIEKFNHPDTVHAICEEFRASPTLDYQQDEADRGNRKISCPVLFLWSQRGSVAKLYDDPLAIWREWADDVRGDPVPVGHFIPEEASEETTRQLLNFMQ